MPEVVRGIRASLQLDRDGQAPETPTREGRGVHFGAENPDADDVPSPGIHHADSRLSISSARRKSFQRHRRRTQDMTSPERAAYYDSRAATKREFRRRASTLQEYYQEHPELLPQLPFTFRHGFKRFKLGFTIFIMVVDACVIPLVLYYTMKYIGHIQGWISQFALLAFGPMSLTCSSLRRRGQHLGWTYICGVRGSVVALDQERKLLPTFGDLEPMGIRHHTLDLGLDDSGRDHFSDCRQRAAYRVDPRPGHAWSFNSVLHRRKRVYPHHVQPRRLESAIPNQFDTKRRPSAPWRLLPDGGCRCR